MKSLSTIPSALYVDLELNCPDRFRPGDADPEIIEIGVVELGVASPRIARERDYLVHPQRDISRRASKITGLKTEDFKGTKSFRDVIGRISAEWPKTATCIAWGEDGSILTRACRQHRVRMPLS